MGGGRGEGFLLGSGGFIPSMMKALLREPGTKRFVLLAIAFALLTVPLGRVHPVFALLSVVPASLIAYLLCDVISRIVFGKEFIFVSKFGLNRPEEKAAIKRSDYVLTLVCAMLVIIGLFLVGEGCDRFHGTDVWKWDLPWFK
jgi:small-conductance mechanosensitive channel